MVLRRNSAHGEGFARSGCVLPSLARNRRVLRTYAFHKVFQGFRLTIRCSSILLSRFACHGVSLGRHSEKRNDFQRFAPELNAQRGFRKKGVCAPLACSERWMLRIYAFRKGFEGFRLTVRYFSFCSRAPGDEIAETQGFTTFSVGFLRSRGHFGTTAPALLGGGAVLIGGGV